jgi:hypothetical protein
VTNQDESFFQEVEERMRQDKVMSALKKHGVWIIGAFVALLIGIAAWQGWGAWRDHQAKAQADTFLAARAHLESGDMEAASAAFEALETKGSASYRSMAIMERAAILETQGDLDGAVAQFDRAADTATDDLMADTARLRAAYIVADTQDFQALRTRLEPLTAGTGQMSFLAKELLGVEAWEAGEFALARETLDGLTLAFDAPESVRQRAGIVLALLGPAPASDAAPAAPSEAGETE